jgi:hypothetical protein
VLAVDPADHEDPRLIGGAGWDLQQGWIAPEGLSIEEIDAVLGLVGRAPLGLRPISPQG